MRALEARGREALLRSVSARLPLSPGFRYSAGTIKDDVRMNLEIHKLELAQRVQTQIQSGHFQDADDLLEKALDALDEQSAAAAAPETATGAVALGGSPGVAL